MLDEFGNEVDISKSDGEEAAAVIPPITPFEEVKPEEIVDEEMDEELEADEVLAADEEIEDEVDVLLDADSDME